MAPTTRIRSGTASEDLAKLLLRLALGILILLHGLGKVSGGVSGIIGMVERVGLPSAFGYLVYVGEVLAPLLLIVGAWTRIAALIIAINMVVAVALAHMKDLATLTNTGGWALELQGMFFITAIALALLGAGRYSISGSYGRWN